MDTIRFGTDGWRATLDEFTNERVRMVAQAVATYLDDMNVDGGVLVGYDARETSRGFAEEVARTLCAAGRDVLVPSRDCPTPVVAWSVVDRGLAGAVMITASHNPPEYNGVKFIPADGAPALPAVTDAIEARLAPPDPVAPAEYGKVNEPTLVDEYAEHALGFIETLEGVTVAYDAMHGSGRGVTDELLDRAGATVVRIRCNRDPTFGGTPPEPTAEHLDQLIREVQGDDEIDLGIANDGDADRLAVVTGSGVVDANLFFAMLYAHLLDQESGPAVRTVSTTFLIDRIADAHDEAVYETPVGFKWIAEAMAEHDALVGGEESGGFTIRGHVREKDGVLLALIAAAMAREQSIDERISKLLDEYGRVYQDRVSLACPETAKSPVIAALGDTLPDSIAGVAVDRVNEADGLKILLDDGSWLLVRPSGTEPKLRVYAEAETESRLDSLLAAGRELVQPLIADHDSDSR